MRCLILFLSLFLFSCKESGKGYVKGTVFDGYTGNPMEGIPIYLIDRQQEAKGQSTYFYDTIIRTYTDANGKFNIKYKNSRGWQFKNFIAVGLPNGYNQGGESRELVYKKTAVSFSLY